MNVPRGGRGGATARCGWHERTRSAEDGRERAGPPAVRKGCARRPGAPRCLGRGASAVRRRGVPRRGRVHRRAPGPSRHSTPRRRRLRTRVLRPHEPPVRGRAPQRRACRVRCRAGDAARAGRRPGQRRPRIAWAHGSTQWFCARGGAGCGGGRARQTLRSRRRGVGVCGGGACRAVLHARAPRYAAVRTRAPRRPCAPRSAVVCVPRPGFAQRPRADGHGACARRRRHACAGTALRDGRAAVTAGAAGERRQASARHRPPQPPHLVLARTATRARGGAAQARAAARAFAVHPARTPAGVEDGSGCSGRHRGAAPRPGRVAVADERRSGRAAGARGDARRRRAGATLSGVACRAVCAGSLVLEWPHTGWCALCSSACGLVSSMCGSGETRRRSGGWCSP